MNRSLREYFDQQLEQVLRELPPRIHELLERLPLVVEDHPSREIMRSLGVRRRSDLCGLYTGIPLTHRSIELPAVPSDVVHIFREGILALAGRGRNEIDAHELRRQIRITILHELGHHHGLSERELEELGY
jgi:predicted Zn-dependent protease with MMP-like domain